MRPNWTAIIMTVLTVLVGLTCLLLALTLGKDNQTATGILFATAGTALGAFFKSPLAAGTSGVRDQSDSVTPSSRDSQAGHVLRVNVFVMLAASAVVGLILLFSMAVHADTPISKCWATVCAEPQVSISLLQYDLTDKKIGAGILPVGSVGYGLRLPNDYLAAGIFLSAKLAGDGPNFIAPAVLFRVMHAFTFGPAIYLGEDKTRWLLEFGGGFGL